MEMPARHGGSGVGWPSPLSGTGPRGRPAPAPAQALQAHDAQHRQPLPHRVAAEAGEAGRYRPGQGDGGHRQRQALGEGSDRGQQARAQQQALDEPEPEEDPGLIRRVEAVDALLTLGGHRRLPSSAPAAGGA